jgi:hypothetical protein
VLKAGRNVRPVAWTLVIYWAITLFTGYAIGLLFLGTLFLGHPDPFWTHRMLDEHNFLP